MQERFHNMSPGAFESMFIKTGDSEKSEGLGIEKVIRESIGSASLMFWDRSDPRRTVWTQ